MCTPQPFAWCHYLSVTLGMARQPLPRVRVAAEEVGDWAARPLGNARAGGVLGFMLRWPRNEHQPRRLPCHPPRGEGERTRLIGCCRIRTGPQCHGDGRIRE